MIVIPDKLLFFAGVFIAVGLLVVWLGRVKPYPWTFHARVTWVCDGDTVWVRTFWGRRLKLRLIGMDAPESNQNYGRESQRCLDRLVGGRFVKVTVICNDKYGRYVAKIMKGSTDVSLRMIEEGMAWAYVFSNVPKEDAKAYKAAAAKAKKEGKGLWYRGKPEAPWDYRRRQRTRWQRLWAAIVGFFRKLFGRS